MLRAKPTYVKLWSLHASMLGQLLHQSSRSLSTHPALEPFWLNRLASTEPTISWSWWKIINGSTMSPSVLPENNTSAMGSPAINDIFVPAKNIAI